MKSSVDIKLTKGKIAKVCPCHLNIVEDYHWQFHRNGYAIAGKHIDGVHKVIRMHRLVNNTPDGKDTDHISRDKLDNRCSNLRTATRSQNNRNSKLHVNNTSGIRGVTWDKINQKWVAQISSSNKCKKLGRFSSLEDAAEAYNTASKELYGAFHV